MASGGPASPAIDRPAQAGPLGLTSCCLCEALPRHLTSTGELPGAQTFGKGGARLPQKAGIVCGSRPPAGCLHGWRLSSALSPGHHTLLLGPLSLSLQLAMPQTQAGPTWLGSGTTSGHPAPRTLPGAGLGSARLVLHVRLNRFPSVGTPRLPSRSWFSGYSSI